MFTRHPIYLAPLDGALASMGVDGDDLLTRQSLFE
jgi:hypothetical protein